MDLHKQTKEVDKKPQNRNSLKNLELNVLETVPLNPHETPYHRDAVQQTIEPKINDEQKEEELLRDLKLVLKFLKEKSSKYSKKRTIYNKETKMEFGEQSQNKRNQQFFVPKRTLAKKKIANNTIMNNESLKPKKAIVESFQIVESKLNPSESESQRREVKLPKNKITQEIRYKVPEISSLTQSEDNKPQKVSLKMLIKNINSLSRKNEIAGNKFMNAFNIKNVIGLSSKRRKRLLKNDTDINSKLSEHNVKQIFEKLPENIKKSIRDNRLIRSHSFKIQKQKQAHNTMTAERDLINLFLFDKKVSKFLPDNFKTRSKILPDNINTRLGTYILRIPITFEKSRKSQKSKSISTLESMIQQSEHSIAKKKKIRERKDRKKHSEGKEIEKIQIIDPILQRKSVERKSAKLPSKKSEKFVLKVVGGKKLQKGVDMVYFLRDENISSAAVKPKESYAAVTVKTKEFEVLDSDSSDDDTESEPQPNFTQMFDDFLLGNEPEQHLLVKSQHSFIQHQAPDLTTKKKHSKKSRSTRVSNANVELAKEDAEVRSSGASSRASEESYNEWLRTYSSAPKEGLSHKPRKYSQGPNLSGSDNSQSSIYSRPSPKISHGNYPELNERRSFILSVVAPINYEGFSISQLRSWSNLSNVKRQFGNYEKRAAPAKSRIYFEKAAKAEAEASMQKPKYKQKFQSQALRKYSFDSITEERSAQIEWDQHEKHLLEKRIAVQAKIAELMQIVQIREIKRKKPKRDFLKEAQTQLWPTRKSQKDTIEKQIPKKRFTTKMEVIKMPGELSHLKPILVRRYGLSKRKELAAELESNRKDFCGTCCMFGLGKKQSDTPLIREMKAKNHKIKLLTYCHLWKQRRKALLRRNNCGCVTSVNLCMPRFDQRSTDHLTI